MIALIIINHYMYTPYIWKYIDELIKSNKEYEIIMWDREPDKNNYTIDNLIVYKLKSKTQKSRIFKFFDFIRFSRFVTKMINKKKYEKIIFFTTMSAFFLKKKIFRKYKDKYIFDYRDASYEFIRPFKQKVDYIIKYSYANVLSSPGFLNILGNIGKYCISHNTKSFYLREYNSNFIKEKIIVSYIGVLRETNYMIKNIDIFGRDNRFELRIYGFGYNIDFLRKHVIKKGYSNIYIHGKYYPDEKEKFILESDCLLYNYLPSFKNNYALANKFYDGIIYGKPLITHIGTYSAELVEENYLGIAIDINNDNCLDTLYDFLVNFNMDIYNKNRSKIIEKIYKDENDFIRCIRTFINN